MASYINYKDTIFEQSKIPPIRGETTFKAIYNIRNEIKANMKYVYSNIIGGAHGHLSLVLNHDQYAVILNTPFV